MEHALAHLSAPVRLLLFLQTFGCDTCPAARRILNEVARLSPQIAIAEYNLVLDQEKAREFGIERAPAVAFVGAADTGIRFYGVPDGYELTSLIDAIQLTAAGHADLSPESQALVAGVDRPLHVQVFVTPT
jgi:alkyl hydroperoxide reductase subunit AhpF